MVKVWRLFAHGKVFAVVCMLRLDAFERLSSDWLTFHNSLDLMLDHEWLDNKILLDVANWFIVCDFRRWYFTV